MLYSNFANVLFSTRAKNLFFATYQIIEQSNWLISKVKLHRERSSIGCCLRGKTTLRLVNYKCVNIAYKIVHNSFSEKQMKNTIINHRFLQT